MKYYAVTGAAGFLGMNLVECLLRHGHFVYAIVRPDSAHNQRLHGLTNVSVIECELADYDQLAERIQKSCDGFFHLAWQGARDDFAAQIANLQPTLAVLQVAKKLGCKRFLATGSQAEYGVLDTAMPTNETALPHPINAYGAAKLATCMLTRERARELGLAWLWARVFSVYGKYEPQGRMLPELVAALKRGKDFSLHSTGAQWWDFIAAYDAAEALLALMEHGKEGEIYDLADGRPRALKDFIFTASRIFCPTARITYGEEMALGLRPSTTKLRQDTGWKPQRTFEDGLLQEYGR